MRRRVGEGDERSGFPSTVGGETGMFKSDILLGELKLEPGLQGLEELEPQEMLEELELHEELAPEDWAYMESKTLSNAA